MDDMRSFDEPMPQVEEAAEKGLPFINYPIDAVGDYPQAHRGRVAWNINKFIVFVGQWAKPIEADLSQMIEKELALPYFEFVYDNHWDPGHGWSGDI